MRHQMPLTVCDHQPPQPTACQPTHSTHNARQPTCVWQKLSAMQLAGDRASHAVTPPHFQLRAKAGRHPRFKTVTARRGAFCREKKFFFSVEKFCY